MTWWHTFKLCKRNDCWPSIPSFLRTWPAPRNPAPMTKRFAPRWMGFCSSPTPFPAIAIVNRVPGDENPWMPHLSAGCMGEVTHSAECMEQVTHGVIKTSAYSGVRQEGATSRWWRLKFQRTRACSIKKKLETFEYYADRWEIFICCS